MLLYIYYVNCSLSYRNYKSSSVFCPKKNFPREISVFNSHYFCFALIKTWAKNFSNGGNKLQDAAFALLNLQRSIIEKFFQGSSFGEMTEKSLHWFAAKFRSFLFVIKLNKFQ
jgi:uncharacterized membrane protein